MSTHRYTDYDQCPECGGTFRPGEPACPHCGLELFDDDSADEDAEADS